MASSDYNLLSYGANNSTVCSFEQLVCSQTGDNIDEQYEDLSSTLPTRHTAELDQELYDKSYNLAETKTVSLSRIDDASTHKYGTFSGGTVYKNYNGDIDTSVKNVHSQDGWIITDNSSGKYCLFTNDNQSYIIAIRDFTPKPIVDDFTPLYNVLSQQKYANSELYSDNVNTSTSLATTLKSETSVQINNDNTEVRDLIQADREITPAEYRKEVSNRKSTHKHVVNSAPGYRGIYPQQIGSSRNAVKNDSVYNNIQAVVYDMPNGSSADKNGIADSMNQLFCYQQPDSVSFTSSAGYEAVSPRGTQQPFQFYTGANAMSLSFTLRWHIDEVRTFAVSKDRHLSLQEIADIADGFTRPWGIESGASLQQKLCKVILPGISEIGYITQAQVNYSGDMSGSYTTSAGVLTGGGEINGTVTDYFYSQLEITFELLMVRDIKLLSAQSRGAQFSIYAEGATVDRDNNQQTQTVEVDSQVEEATEIEEIVENSAIVEEEPTGYYDDVAGMCLPENSSNLLGYEDEELGMSIPYSTPYYTPADYGSGGSR